MKWKHWDPHENNQEWLQKTHSIVSELGKIEVFGQIVLSIEANRDAMKDLMVATLPVVNNEDGGDNGLCGQIKKI